MHGSELTFVWGIPFVGMLLSIALFPLFAPKFWHHHHGKIALGWCGALLLPMLMQFASQDVVAGLAHVMIEEYIPFVLLLGVLFVISSGIHIDWGTVKATPRANTIILGVGALLASVMGTTGAAMLMIRPLLKLNYGRRYQVHVIIFFIFLVANIGGGMTPVGDPPLFLGFLKGVDFMWTVKAMVIPVLSLSGILLGLFYLWDRYYFNKEYLWFLSRVHRPKHGRLFKIKGKHNFIFLGLLLVTTISTGLWKDAGFLHWKGLEFQVNDIVRDVSMILIATLSWVSTHRFTRARNHFDWFPMIEVAQLFLGIFITMLPVTLILKSGVDGAAAPLLSWVGGVDDPQPWAYFLFTGLLSGFLDNAPSYLVFFNLAGGDPIYLMTEGYWVLLAISMGSVFMGAMTYIGNAPNLMVKSIAHHRGITMPSFFGYMVWSCLILLPLLLAVAWVLWWING